MKISIGYIVIYLSGMFMLPLIPATIASLLGVLYYAIKDRIKPMLLCPEKEYLRKVGLTHLFLLSYGLTTLFWDIPYILVIVLGEILVFESFWKQYSKPGRRHIFILKDRLSKALLPVYTSMFLIFIFTLVTVVVQCR